MFARRRPRSRARWSTACLGIIRGQGGRLLHPGGGVHPLEAKNDKKIYDFNYRAVKESIERALKGQPKIDQVISQAKTASIRSPVVRTRLDLPGSRLIPRRGRAAPSTAFRALRRLIVEHEP